jgi:hypothetical protein
MSTNEIVEFYEHNIAALPAEEQLLLASHILQRVTTTDADIFHGHDPAELARRQRAELRKVCGIYHDPDPTVSERHDDFLYGPSNP